MQMVENSMQNWKTMLTSAEKELAEVHISRGIFQGDSLSPLLFVICLIPMLLVLRKVKAGYSFGNDKLKVNHMLFMNDMKLFGRSSVEIDKLVSTVYLVSGDMRMEFGIRKSGVLVPRVLEPREVKILWDFSVHTDHEIEARKTDIIIIDKTSKECHFIEITCLLDWSILERENFKVDKYQDLKREVAKLWNDRPIVIPVAIGALGMLTNRLEGKCVWMYLWDYYRRSVC